METIKIEWFVSTDKTDSKRSYTYDTGMTKEQWNTLSSQDKIGIISEVIFQHIEWGWEEDID